MYSKDDIIFRCGICGKPFKLVNGKYSLYYRCPNYELIERGAGKKPCMNRMSLKDEDILFEELRKMNDSGKLEPGNGSRKINLVYKIHEKEDDYLSVYVINTFKIKLGSGSFT